MITAALARARVAGAGCLVTATRRVLGAPTARALPGVRELRTAWGPGRTGSATGVGGRGGTARGMVTAVSPTRCGAYGCAAPTPPRPAATPTRTSHQAPGGGGGGGEGEGGSPVDGADLRHAIAAHRAATVAGAVVPDAHGRSDQAVAALEVMAEVYGMAALWVPMKAGAVFSVKGDDGRDDV